LQTIAHIVESTLNYTNIARAMYAQWNCD